MTRPSCKNLILDAAETVVLRVGAAHMTLDAVAEEAGVSKGGVLYHFPAKEALLECMLRRHVERGVERRRETIEQIPLGPARELKGEIVSQVVARDPNDRMCAAFLAAIANEPKLMSIIREIQCERYGRLAKPDLPFERCVVLLLAVDGLFFHELLQSSPFTAEQRQKIVETLLSLADDLAGKA